MSEIDITEIDIDMLVDCYKEIKQRRSRLSEQDKALKAKQDRLEMEFNNRCLKMGVDSFKANGMNITRTVKRTYIVSDGVRLLDWAKENDRPDMISVKTVASVLKEYLDNSGGQLPDGMATIEKYTVSVTSSRS